jgi:hypothetical protein
MVSTTGVCANTVAVKYDSDDGRSWCGHALDVPPLPHIPLLLDRLSYVIKQKLVPSGRAWSAKAFGKDKETYLGATMSKLRSGTQTGIGSDEMVQLATAAGVSIAWLSSGRDVVVDLPDGTSEVVTPVAPPRTTDARYRLAKEAANWAVEEKKMSELERINFLQGDQSFDGIDTPKSATAMLYLWLSERRAKQAAFADGWEEAAGALPQTTVAPDDHKNAPASISAKNRRRIPRAIPAAQEQPKSAKKR